jgi:hypothetical protein
MSVPRIPGRGALLQLISDLSRERNILSGELKAKKSSYHSLRALYQPEIDSLSQEADVLAKKFRELYRQAAEAYSDEDGALAKVLSLEGKEVQRECEALNGKANVLRMELKTIHDRIDFLYLEIKKISERINEAREFLKNARKTIVGGFSMAGISDTEAENILDKVPQRVLSEVEEVKFRLDKLDNATKLGDTRWHPMTNKAFVRVYKHEFRHAGREGETIIHEVGHEIFLKFLSDKEKGDWEELYSGSGDWFISDYAMRSFEEDFCECFAAFFTEKVSLLARRGFEKYTFIEKIIRRLEQLS